MSNKHKIDEEEIDLTKLVITLWNGKWIILFISVITFMLVYIHHYLNPRLNFTASNNIRSISFSDIEDFRQYNAMVNKAKSTVIKINALEDQKVKEIVKVNFFEVTPNILLELFLEQLDRSNLVENAIIKFNLIDKSDFSNDLDYKKAVTSLANEFRILDQQPNNKKQNKDEKKTYLLKFYYNDVNKWEQALKYITNKNNEAVKELLFERIQNSIIYAKRQISFELEDIKIKINNEISSYDIELNSRIAYLSEQASIARKINLKVGFDDIQKSYVIFPNRITSLPLYLRGYIPIEKEIELIKKRTEKNYYINNIQHLERSKLLLENDKSIQRIEKFFGEIQVNTRNFQAALVNTNKTKYLFNYWSKINYIIALIFGSLLGAVYVLIKNRMDLVKKI